MPISTSSPNVLLVEGTDDEHVVKHIRCQSQQMPDFEIINKGGINALLESIRVEARVPSLATLGILVDADDDVNGRWGEISDKLQTVNINVPASPDPNGTIIDCVPRIGIWMMPDNKSSGELENFIEKMIPPSDQIWPRSMAYINGIPMPERKFVNSDRKIVKAKVHAWLAARKFPGLMGVAIRERDLDINVSDSTNFVDWLRRLFS